MINILYTLSAYLFGALPFGLFIARMRGVDIRTQGSGNIGATNVFRVVGKGWGVLTFTLDALKGFLPAFIFPLLAGVAADWGVLFGLAAILGHSFPVYLKFKGGKGVATSAGMLLGVAPLSVGAALFCWLITMIISRYVSLASIAAAATVGIAVWVDPSLQDRLLSRTALTLMALLVIGLHRANIRRLLNGTEHRFGKKRGGQTEAATP